MRARERERERTNVCQVSAVERREMEIKYMIYADFLEASFPSRDLLMYC